MPKEGHGPAPRALLVRAAPRRRGPAPGNRHTMLDDTDISAQRHIRGAVAGLVAGVVGDGRLFVSGGAEHQGPDGGGLIAVIASQSHGGSWGASRLSAPRSQDARGRGNLEPP